MRLKKLQVSGFKSFVDKTDIRLPGHLVGVVGPNGSGKSNVIDAVRWVMGESSAKMLRGDNMADVIFNGSVSRKAVGKASVELIFDNSDGNAPGNYGQFTEISVKRTLTRDGQSAYSINNIKTRRKDVLDLFRGTGLGPRSYSIIEQGMVSRIIEARPEDLRVFVEEAAGTSKYKDRRRETENRIAHTRENLDRVADIRDELAKQLRRLKRQSASARRYKILKQEERQVGGQLLALRLQAQEQQIGEQDRLGANYENALQSSLAQQRATESELETLRSQQSEVHDKNNQIQQAFYRLGAEITNLEQRIEYTNETRQRQAEEAERLHSSTVERQEEIKSGMQRGGQLRQQLAALEPELVTVKAVSDEAQENLANSERVLQEWLTEMEAFNEQSREPAQQVEVQKSRIAYLQQHLERTAENQSRIEQQTSDLKQNIASSNIQAQRQEVADHDREYATAEKVFHEIEAQIKQINEQLELKREQAAEIRNQLQDVTSRLNSLQEIQNATLSEDDDTLDNWLHDKGLHHAPRLAAGIHVEAGWERAADRVLNGFLSAICTDHISSEILSYQPNCGFSMISSAATETLQDRISLPRLVDKVRADSLDVSPLLNGIYIAEDTHQAMQFQSQLMGRECVVTREGGLVGANWVSFVSESQLETGVLVREEEISKLAYKKIELGGQVEQNDQEINSIEEQRKQVEVELLQQRSKVNDLRSEITSLHNKLGREEAQYVEANEQIENLAIELNKLQVDTENDKNEIANAQTLLDSASQQSGDLDLQRQKLIERRDILSVEVAQSRQKTDQARENLHHKALQKQRLETDIVSINENIDRLKREIEQAQARLIELGEEESRPGESIDLLKSNLLELMNSKIGVEERFTASKDVASEFDALISQVNNKRNEQNEQVNQSREVLHQHRLNKQEILTRRDTLVESINEQGFDMDQCRSTLPDSASVAQWQVSLDDIERKITRIGPVNLVAIEEFDEESERMEYLDKQHSDLTEALDTLESVIRKIDRETKTRFKETFDNINLGFKAFFPKLFGGGRAELQLTSDDLLNTGISVMARPPGKRNSHIHLLSGGEKALAAVALLFSLFKLNPAPFCMLDEVDAPLDDANVDRFCETLKTLADLSQIIVITHNKITMESMDLLVGVTMQEAGVSRLVSVDIDQAVEMASQ